MSIPAEYRTLADFQVSVAEAWLQAALRLPLGQHPHFEFVAYYSAFNALYMFWGTIHDSTDPPFSAAEVTDVMAAIDSLPQDLRHRVKNRLRAGAGELSIVRRTIRLLPLSSAQHVLSDPGVSSTISYLCGRPPIERMGDRQPDGVTGQPQEGARAQEKLQERNADPITRLTALGDILYLIRCNLVHGSKEPGYDETLLRRTTPAIHEIANALLAYTKRERSVPSS